MSHGTFIIALTLIVLGAVVILYACIRAIGIEDDEPTEHGDGEP